MNTTKEMRTLVVHAREDLGMGNYLLRLRPSDGRPMLPMMAGQFVQVMPPGGVTLLRRPISICNVVHEDNELWLLVARVGRGTVAITDTPEGSALDLIMPLGNSFTLTEPGVPLLVGGGVGIAPMLMLARAYQSRGIRPRILLGGRTAGHVVLREAFAELGELLITTDDGSLGVSGRVTDHPIWQETDIARVHTCGPMPMMRAVARVCAERTIPCEVSLENTMACGIGACLCCVQDTHSSGNVCVCTEGPVFDANDIKW